MTTSGGLKRTKSGLTFQGSVVSGHLKKKKNRSFLFIFYLVIKL